MKTAEEIQAQIDIIESLFDRGLKDSFQTLSTGKRLYDDVINPTIKDLKEQLKHASQRQEWIPVELMPEYDGLYLCWIIEEQPYGNIWEYWEVVNCLNNKWATNKTVTHWQPLPPKPTKQYGK